MITALVISDPQLAMLTPPMCVPVDPGIREKHEISQTACEVQRSITRLHWPVGLLYPPLPLRNLPAARPFKTLWQRPAPLLFFSQER